MRGLDISPPRIHRSPQSACLGSSLRARAPTSVKWPNFSSLRPARRSTANQRLRPGSAPVSSEMLATWYCRRALGRPSARRSHRPSCRAQTRNGDARGAARLVTPTSARPRAQHRSRATLPNSRSRTISALQRTATRCCFRTTRATRGRLRVPARARLQAPYATSRLHSPTSEPSFRLGASWGPQRALLTAHSRCATLDTRMAPP